MFWRKTTSPPIKNPQKKNGLSLVKPSPRPRLQRSNRIDLKVPCYLLVEEEDYLLQTTTINVSKTGMLVRTLDPLKTGQEVICLLSNHTNLNKVLVRCNKYQMKGKIVRVVKEEALYQMAIQITLGRVDPDSFLEGAHFDKHWWTRSWQ
ncbi:MAG: PilZ domain-containing protein [Candidatus Omnitrophota bacterium]